ncbi:hypothetical protein EDB87DRAFT_1587030 [Lactarius vividus]|nr:hypothetical protein EDB87DRAFT_1587030 [Lactarius vividus]
MFVALLEWRLFRRSFLLIISFVGERLSSITLNCWQRRPGSPSSDQIRTGHQVIWRHAPMRINTSSFPHASTSYSDTNHPR